MSRMSVSLSMRPQMNGECWVGDRLHRWVVVVGEEEVVVMEEEEGANDHMYCDGSKSLC